ncbi:Multidrug resistance efflux pump [Desulfobacula phenolica]|uniref:Multidrug resistance efflux pump n=1 Tax=Desulfobacula phenolica TaxID=90732 RepID=A0A1H2IQL4_9BACT|nr:Multidrug resistance efflux pump [Desulfobacula phenolica]
MRRQNKGNVVLYGVWFIILTATIAITRFYSVESSNFYGIAETREIVVNFEGAVEIKKIDVTEGQSVEQGMLMVELSSPDLMLKINHISHQLDQLKAQKGVDKSEIQSRLRQLKAQKAAKENELKNQIAQLENQYKINKSLLSGLKSIPGGSGYGNDEGRSPMEMKIRSLKEELRLCINPLAIQIELFQKTLANSKDPVKIQVERLEKELSLLRDENSKLKIYAQISGIIGSVNFKPGAKVSPFAPILTLHTRTPSFIKGYIYENAYADISMGEKITVASLAIANRNITGVVVGIGARIVAYPERLRKHPDLQMWGREVVIQIPANNHFILGEKVLITSSLKKARFTDQLKRLFTPSQSIADVLQTCKNFLFQEKILPIIPLETEGIEASALLYLEDIDRYMVLSDDTLGNAPLVMLMDSNGRITRETPIAGLDRIDDMESVAEGEQGILYISSSLGTGRKGKIKAARKHLISVQRQENHFSLLGMVDLYSLFMTHAETAAGKPWADFILGGILKKTLDMEGMMYREGTLFLGFKAPLMNQKSVVLKINEIDQVIKTKKLKPGQISIWQTVRLQRGEDQLQEGISDLLYFEGALYLTGTPLIKKEGSRSGSLWKLEESAGTPICLTHFNDLQPEGVAVGKEKNTLIICFDQGRKIKSKICVVKVK